MAHELRTPVAVVQASTEAMTDQVVDVSPDQIDSLHEEAAKLSGLVDKLQRITAAEAASTGLELEDSDVGVIAATVADSLDSLFRRQQIRLNRRLDSVHVQGDATRIREIITNLLSNAAKFTPAGGQVSLETYAAADVAVLQVSDTGPGIPPEDLPLVAKRFYRSRNTADVPGSGLGLAIVDELVRAHGGTMTITSQLGQGTSVAIQLPRRDTNHHRTQRRRHRSKDRDRIPNSVTPVSPDAGQAPSSWSSTSRTNLPAPHATDKERMIMNKFLIEGKYSSGSWARMIKRDDDRAAVLRALMDSLGGGLDQLYWEVESAAAYALADLPDAITIEAIITALDGTGAFRSVEAHELLTQDQLRDALTLAADASHVYRVPGHSAVGS
jgi:two-component sensor histidine kinase